MEQHEQPKEKKEKNTVVKREEEILAFWQRENIFEKSLAKPSPRGEFVFYDGPPFATGLPHYGHILTGTIKDVIPRYKTMRGYHVPRRWGWDCHGLPVENEVEKELGFKAKKEIEEYGIEKFNTSARETVMRYADDWRRIVPRLGRWVDMENDYRTMDSHYTESVWWVFKSLFDKGLIEEGFKSMHLCPRCETTLSNFEVSQGYKETADISVTVKFELVAQPGTYLLAWTTTPWTLPGNVALAVGKDVNYVKIKYQSIANARFAMISRENRVQTKQVLISSGTYILAEEIFWKNLNSNAGLSELRILLGVSNDDLLKDLVKFARDKDGFFEKYQEKIERLKGKDLVGLEYKPAFDYYANDPTLKNRENGWKIYAADFVTTEEGTGIVHIAPAFGEDDYQLSLREKLPFIQHVGTDGRFKKEVKDFAGMPVKPIEDPQKTDVEILKYLARADLLFAKEKITHQYPFCWRCDTPLLNYAASSWFVAVSRFRKKLVAANQEVQWVPPEIGMYRFGNWLKEARDWAISRSRFWGAPIPVWRCDKCRSSCVIGSLDELISRSIRSGNSYFVMRHGEAENNVKGIISSEEGNPHHLTEKGKKGVADAAEALRRLGGVDRIIHSPFLRTTETAKIVGELLGIPSEKISSDPRIREVRAGVFNGKSIREYHGFFRTLAERFTKAPSGGETYREMKRRMGEFLYSIDRRFKGERILIITHDAPGWLLIAAAAGLTEKETIARRRSDEFYIKNAEVKTLPFTPLPHNGEYALDLHRPYIDAVELCCNSCDGVMRRVRDVFDCWFESGSMPYGEAGYKGVPLPDFDPRGGLFRRSKGFPADFIAEGLDQTRGWFYSMLVLGTALFGKSPYRTVVVNGTVLAEDGQKMSKRLKNYPDPLAIVERYGADALRQYLLSAPVVRGEDFSFSERGVDEVAKKILNRLHNVFEFYRMYANGEGARSAARDSRDVIDRWIIARLDQVTADVTVALDTYELNRAARPLGVFVDDLSTWYLRRSRERIKNGGEEGKAALATLGFVLRELSKIMAPFMPFYAEYLYQELNINLRMGANDPNKKESVHLESWPMHGTPDRTLLAQMERVRSVVERSLAARSAFSVKVRQPLSRLSLHHEPFADVSPADRAAFFDLIKDEVNVKEIVIDPSIQGELSLDTAITPELKEEGQLREFIHAVQDERKRGGLAAGELAVLEVAAESSSRAFLERHDGEIKQAGRIETIRILPSVSDATSLQLTEELTFTLKVRKH